jgi:hypothetical protein
LAVGGVAECLLEVAVRVTRRSRSPGAAGEILMGHRSRRDSNDADQERSATRNGDAMRLAASVGAIGALAAYIDQRANRRFWAVRCVAAVVGIAPGIPFEIASISAPWSSIQPIDSPGAEIPETALCTDGSVSRGLWRTHRFDHPRRASRRAAKISANWAAVARVIVGLSGRSAIVRPSSRCTLATYTAVAFEMICIRDLTRAGR